MPRRNTHEGTKPLLATVSPAFGGDLAVALMMLGGLGNVQAPAEYLTVYTFSQFIFSNPDGFEDYPVFTPPEDGAEAEQRLRNLTSKGFLLMSAHREDGQFVEYRWTLKNKARS